MITREDIISFGWTKYYSDGSRARFVKGNKLYILTLTWDGHILIEAYHAVFKSVYAGRPQSITELENVFKDLGI